MLISGTPSSLAIMLHLREVVGAVWNRVMLKEAEDLLHIHQILHKEVGSWNKFSMVTKTLCTQHSWTDHQNRTAKIIITNVSIYPLELGIHLKMSHYFFKDSNQQSCSSGIELNGLKMWFTHSEPAPTSAPWRMNGKWSGNSSLLGSSSPWWLAQLPFFYLHTNNPQAGC